MELPRVEPVDGPEVDRLITALLNVSGVIHQMIGETPSFVADGYGADGRAVMRETAERIRTLLAQVVELHDDEELAYVRHFLAVVTVVLADGIGSLDLFRAPPG